MLGSSGTTYSDTRIFPTGDHQIEFNFTPILQPGETIIYHTVNSVNTSACTCPVIVNFVYVPPTPTPTTTPTNTPTPTETSTPTPSVTTTNTPSITPTNTTTPTNTPTPSSTPPPFDPSQLNNLYDWWVADTGVGLSGGTGTTVTGWTGYNGLVFTANSLTYPPALVSTDSFFNNQSSIRFNPTSASTQTAGMKVPNSNFSGSITTIMVYMVEGNSYNYSIDADTMYIGTFFNDQMTAFGLSFNVWYLYANSGSFQINTGTTYNTDVPIFQRYTFDRPNSELEYYMNNTNDLTTLLATGSSGSADCATGNLGIFDWEGYFGYTPVARVIEVIHINGIPSGTELTNLQTYYSTKYGL